MVVENTGLYKVHVAVLSLKVAMTRPIVPSRRSIQTCQRFLLTKQLDLLLASPLKCVINLPLPSDDSLVASDCDRISRVVGYQPSTLAVGAVRVEQLDVVLDSLLQDRVIHLGVI